MQITAENPYPIRRTIYHCHYCRSAKIKLYALQFHFILYNKTLSIALNKKQIPRLLDTGVLRTYLGTTKN